MRDRTFWQNHVLTESGKYRLKQLPASGTDVYSITPFGEVMQEGTSQDAAHFNSVEESLTALEIAIDLLANGVRQNAWETEKGSVKLTNSSIYPFNNSQKTIALTTRRENSDYIVIPKVTAFSGNVGEIVISDKLVNGFKIAYTGSAKDVTIEYQVIGGYLK